VTKLIHVVVPTIAGQYTVVVSTFEPNQIGKYKLTLQSHMDLPLTPIAVEGAVSLPLYCLFILTIANPKANASMFLSIRACLKRF
jgi:hypothetical protein